MSAELIPVPRDVLLKIADALSGPEFGVYAERIDRLVREADVATLDDFLTLAVNDCIEGR